MRLAVDAQDLLADGVRPARENAGFCGRGPAFDAENAGDFDALVSKILDEGVSSRVVTDRSDGMDACTESRKIVGGVGAAAGKKVRFAVTEDEDRSLARDTRDLAELKFVGDKITEEDHAL